MDAYPRFEMYRTKKDIQLSLPFQQAIYAYYRKYKFFPHPIDAFKQESETNSFLVKDLYQQGFSKLEFLPITKDSLSLEFEFVKPARLYYDTDASISLSPGNSGRFLFVRTAAGYLYCKRYIDRWRQKSKWRQ